MMKLALDWLGFDALEGPISPLGSEHLALIHVVTHSMRAGQSSGMASGTDAVKGVMMRIGFKGIFRGFTV